MTRPLSSQRRMSFSPSTHVLARPQKKALAPYLELAYDIAFRYHLGVNTKQRKSLAAIFARPTLASIVFADIESLIKALGGTVLEREGSRVSVQLMGEEWRCHKPHPGKEAKRYQVEQVRDLLERIGVHP